MSDTATRDVPEKAAASSLAGRAGTFAPCDSFARRHIGSSAEEAAEMLQATGFDSLDALIDAAVPRKIRLSHPLDLPPAKGEHASLTELRELVSSNKICRSYLGM